MSYYNPKTSTFPNLHRDVRMTVVVINWATEAVGNREIAFRQTEDHQSWKRCVMKLHWKLWLKSKNS